MSKTKSFYHRVANSRTQTMRVAKLQYRSGEIWGRGNFKSELPSVAAWLGPLADQNEGIQFDSEIPYAKNGDPAWAIWYLPEHGGDSGVMKKDVGSETFACIKIEPQKYRYRCKP